jgi:hypothetical protein
LRIARVAQLVEQRIENPCVRGSIPRVGTTSQNKKASYMEAFLFLKGLIQRNRRASAPKLDASASDEGSRTDVLMSAATGPNMKSVTRVMGAPIPRVGTKKSLNKFNPFIEAFFI